MIGWRKRLGLACAAVALAAAQDAPPPRSAASDVTLSAGGQRFEWRPRFIVVRADRNPELNLSRAHSDPRQRTAADSPEAFQVPEWRRPDGTGRTDQPLRAGVATVVEATGATTDPDGTVRWTFADQPDFRLEASMAPGAMPTIAFRLTAKRDGWWSVAYAGAPEFDPAKLEEIWQPLVWQERRFPRAPLITPELLAPTPMTSATVGGLTIGVAPDPADIPFRLPTLADSRFGLMLRNAEGRAQPILWAPLLGTEASRLRSGASTGFRLRAIVQPGTRHQVVERIARDLFGFADRRENVGRSLNEVIDNFVRFAMNDRYSGWNADLKGFGYDTDAVGSVKVVSALHPTAVALIRDDPEIYRARALPMTEYLLSREKYLFAVDRRQQTQGASSRMNGPGAEVAEFATLYAIGGRQSPVLLDAAKGLVGKPRALNLDMIYDGNDFRAHLALYRATGERRWLASARRLADRYVRERVERPATDFAEVRVSQGGQFWSDFAPRWIDLFEMWEETGDRRYLDAAYTGARLFASYAWLSPAVPDAVVTVDRGGRAPLTTFIPEGLSYRPMATPERALPAWQVAQTGLVPEASTTAAPNPAVLLAHHAAWFRRLAREKNDRLLHDIGRSAVVGRYATYPGYDINEGFSAVFAREDYPYRPLGELSYNQIYYNHVWPHIALLIDYLLSDVEARTNGAVSFPSRYAPGYAYLQSKVYGDRPGRFYGREGVRLWMPEGLLRLSNPQINHVSGYNDGGVYVALTNEAARPVSATLSFGPDHVEVTPGRRYHVERWVDGKRVGNAELVDGRIDVALSPRGTAALVIRDLKALPRLRPDYEAPGMALGPRSFARTETPAGTLSTMLLGFGGARTDLYAWLSGGPGAVREARLTATLDGREVTLVDRSYPFEFSMPLSPSAQTVGLAIELDTPSGVRRVALPPIKR